jgi:hypothetical protein
MGRFCFTSSAPTGKYSYTPTTGHDAEVFKRLGQGQTCGACGPESMIGFAGRYRPAAGEYEAKRGNQT